MNTLREGTALASHVSGQDLSASLVGLAEARAGRRTVEVRIGVGPLEGSPPARLLGYASILARVLATDVRALVGDAAVRVKLFSSAAKGSRQASGDPSWALAALSGALQLLGVGEPIGVDLSDHAREVPAELDIWLTPRLAQWLQVREHHHSGSVEPSFFYAIEHAAPSMFADLLTAGEYPPFRITLGGNTEGPFWATRMRVREAALAAGLALAPAAGLIVRTLRRPWYQPLRDEPRLDALTQPDIAAAALEDCANPSRGGNAGLKGEARAVRRLVEDPRLPRFADALSSPERARQFLKRGDIRVGPRLAIALGDRP
jgi:hypothetical protein